MGERIVEIVLRGIRVRVSPLVARLVAQGEAAERARGDLLATKTAEIVVEALHRELAAGERAEQLETRVAQLERELEAERTARAADRPAALAAGVAAAREALATGVPQRSEPVLAERHRAAWCGRAGHA